MVYTNTRTKVMCWIGRNLKDNRFVPIIMFCLAFLIFFLRRPDILTNPNLWAEDGVFWLQDAYNNGFLKSMLAPENGYFQTISRLVFGVSSLFPLAWAPLFANTIGLIIRSSLVTYIFSKRIDFINPRVKILFAAYILFMPGLVEVHANITNTHWYLSLYMVLIILSRPALNKAQKLHDYLITTVAALSGPFVILAAPIVLFKVYSKGGTLYLGLSKIKTYLLKNKLLLTVLVLALLQLVTVVITAKSSRSSAPLGFSFDLLHQILTNRIFLGSILPMKYVLKLTSNNYASYLLCFTGLTTVAFTLFKSNWQTRLMILFVAGILALSLIKPMITSQGDQWPLLPYTAGDRYFVIPNIIFFYCFSFTILKLLKGRFLSLLIVPGLSVCILLLMQQFRMPPLLDTGYESNIAKFNSLKKGESIPIPINPEGFSMELIKK